MDEAMEQCCSHSPSSFSSSSTSSWWIADSRLGFRLVRRVACENDTVDDGDIRRKVMVIDDDGQECCVSVCQLLPVAEHRSDETNHDLAMLNELNEATVLQALRYRYSKDQIHTYCGLFLVVLNPWRNLPLMYGLERSKEYLHHVEQLDPHIYAITQNCFDGVQRGGADQSILITGESGSGKSENTRLMLEYLAVAGNCENRKNFDKLLTSASRLLEAFSNAKTARNWNSSRVGKFVKVYFDVDGRLRSVRLQYYLLEKSRLVKYSSCERNFHIFYQLFSMCSDTRRDLLFLTESPCQYRFLNQGILLEDNIDDFALYGMTETALVTLGFSSLEINEILQMVSVCLLIGQLRFCERNGMDICFVEHTKEVEYISKILGVNADRMIDAIAQPTIRIGETTIKRSQNMTKTIICAHSLAKAVYSHLFAWLIARCNRTLIDSELNGKEQEEVNTTRFIGLLDMAGFEIVARNNFEQFCVNYTCEKLQQFFNEAMTERERRTYEMENIQWSSGERNGLFDLPLINIIEQPLGVLDLLQEECLLPKGTDMAFLSKLLLKFSHTGLVTATHPSARNVNFAMKHYAGQVNYSIEGWMEKNCDTLNEDLLQLMKSSRKQLVRELFMSEERRSRGVMASSTVSFVYKEQLKQLLSTLNSTNPQFVRCILPNEQAKVSLFDGALVLNQIRCNGMMESVRIARLGYPNRFTYHQFSQRYGVGIRRRIGENWKDVTQRICREFDVHSDSFQLGKTKLFCRAGLVSELERKRRKRIDFYLTGFQAEIRFHLQQKELDRRIRSRDAILVVQDNVRYFALLRSWPWLRIVTDVIRMVALDRERQFSKLKDRLELLEQEVELLRRRNHILIFEQKTANDQLSEKRVENEDMRTRIENFETDLSEKKQLLATRQHQLEQHRTQVELYSQKLSEQDERMSEILSQLETRQAEVDQARKEWENEKRNREAIDCEMETNRRLVVDLQTLVKDLESQRSRLLRTLEERSNRHSHLEEKANRQELVISDLQNMLLEANGRLIQIDPMFQGEKTSRRKVEKKLYETEQDNEHLRDKLDKFESIVEQLRDKLRISEEHRQSVEKRLEMNRSQVDICIGELKKKHSTIVGQMQDQIEELRKKSTRLELENGQQRNRLDILDEMETSLSESINSSSRRSSGIGSRQMSLTSVNPRRRSSQTDSVDSGWRSFENNTSSIDRYNARSGSIGPLSPLSRTSSSNQLNEMADLERQLQSMKSENKLLKREIQVYKQSLDENDIQCNSLTRQIKALTTQMDLLKNTSTEDQISIQRLEQKVQRLNTDLQHAKTNTQQMLNEKHLELMTEKKKAKDSLDEMQHEHQAKLRKMEMQQRQNLRWREDMAELQSQLDMTRAQLAHFEQMYRAQEKLCDTIDKKQRGTMMELDQVREENASLKSRLRRLSRKLDDSSASSFHEEDCSDKRQQPLKESEHDDED